MTLDSNLKNIHAIRSDVGMVFQSFNLFPHLTVLENCTLAPVWVRNMTKTEAQEIAMEYLTRVKIPELAEKYPGQLSGGQQQRLCIARAMAVGPDVLLMDEPCSALDPVATKKIEDLMQELVKEFSILIVTHNMQQASRSSDYCAFFTTKTSDDGKRRTGELVEFNETSVMFTTPDKELTEQYISGRFG